MSNSIPVLLAREMPLPRRTALRDVVAPWSGVAPVDTVETGMRPEPPLPSPTPEAGMRRRRWIGVGLALGASLAGSLGVMIPSTGWSAEPTTAIGMTLGPAADPFAGMRMASAGPATPAARHYPAIVRHKGDYVAHGVNFSDLISDQEFTGTRALTADQIQAYLTAKGSFLATFKENGRSAARIISETATKNGVNPRVILATLEKETSLVSRHHAPRWVLRSAMGYAYDDGGSTAGRHSTFTSQVEGGTKLLRDSFDQGGALRYPHRFRVDYGRRTISVDNAATYALMTYTPHTTDTHLRYVGGGNHLFANVMRRMHGELQEIEAQNGLVPVGQGFSRPWA